MRINRIPLLVAACLLTALAPAARASSAASIVALRLGSLLSPVPEISNTLAEP